MRSPTPATPTPRASRAGLRRPGAALIRWVLLWFALSLGVAAAAPVVHPQTFELVCSNTGAAKVVVHGDDGAHELGAGAMDCPLCLPGGAPPSMPGVEWPMPKPLAHAVRPVAAAHIAAATAAPPPARGPPSLS
jgi:hypothetical protein